MVRIMSSFLENFDGVSSNTVFCVWSGTNDMSVPRIQALWSIFNNIHCPIVFLTHNSLRKWEYPGAPFHPAFEFLSETHKSDYVRCYLMHHYGGGYTDMKITTKSWEYAFDLLRKSEKLALGYTEIGPHGVAPVGGALGEELRANYLRLIGLCAFIFRKRTELTKAWFEQTESLLDQKYNDLRKSPAKFPQDQLGAQLDDGTLSEYPIRWTELLGNIFHPLINQHHNAIIHKDISPLFYGYR